MSKTPTIASIEARMASSRLPGKVLAAIAGKPALTRVLERLRMAKRLDGIVLATTDSPVDDVLVDWAEAQGLAYYRGDEDDVLGRVVEAHRMMGTETIVEICGDMPLLDPRVVDDAVALYQDGNGYDVVTTTRSPSYPNGVDAQVFSFASLAEIAEITDDPASREHVSLYFYQHPERYQIADLIAPANLEAPNRRLVLDYPEDLALIREIYGRLEPVLGVSFGTADILELLNSEPDIAKRHERADA